MEELGKYIGDKWLEIIQALKILIPVVVPIFKKLIFRLRFHGYSLEATQIASALNNISWSNLFQPLKTIDKIGLIPRLEIDQILEIWKESDAPLLLHGEAGTGKTGIAIRLSQYVISRGTPVLYLNSKDFPLNENPITFIEQRLTVHIPLVEAISKIGKEKSTIVIVDQIDSVAGTDLCKGLISLINTIAAIPNIKVLAVTRSYEYKNDPDISSIGFKTIECNQLSPEQAKDYLAQIGVTDLNPTIVDLSRNLLNLSIIADIINADPLSIKHIADEINLWKRFYISIEKREGEDIVDYAQKLARDATGKNELSFQVPNPRNIWLRKLISRGIITPAPGRRYSFRHEQMQYFLCTYDLMPEIPNVYRLINEFSGKALTSVITWLHRLYHDDNPKLEAEFVHEVLSAEKELPFYSRILVLDNLRVQNHPFDELAAILFKHRENSSYLKYFFNDLENPFWFIPLYHSGMFQNYPEPVRVEGGGYHVPDWPPGDYLLNYAQNYEEIVSDIIAKAKTSNWIIQEKFIDVLEKISPENATHVLPIIDTWIDTPFSGMLPNKLIALTTHLLKINHLDTATQIFAYVVSPSVRINPDQYSLSISPFRFRSETYWVNEYYQKIYPHLLEINPLGLVRIFQSNLEKIIYMVTLMPKDNPELQVGFYWRFDIPFRHSTFNEPDVIDLLVDGLRDSLISLCNRLVNDGRETLEAYLNGDHLILQRIALYALRKCGEKYPDILEVELAKTHYLEDKVFDDDYRGLLRDQFGTIPTDLQKSIINFILSGPSNIEEMAKNWARVENRESTKEDTQLVIDRWRFQLLPLIEKYLSPEELTILTSIKEKYKQEPDTRERPSIEIGPVTTVKSPVSVDELSAMNFQTLKNFLLTYEPEAKYMHSRDSLGRAFQSLVSNNISKYVGFAPLLIDDNIRFVFTYYYLQGITEGIKTNAIQLDNDILQLCNYVVYKSTERDNPQREPYEPGLETAKGQVADLLNDVVKKNDYYLSREQLHSIRRMLVELSDHSNPTEEEERESSMDPFTYSLNCIRGRAMHGILDYSLYIVRQKAEQEGKTRIPGFLEEPIANLLNEKIDPNTEKSPAVHSVFGAYLIQLHYLSKEWLASHLDQIFPSAPEKEIYWRAAWDGYIFGSNVNNDVSKLIIPQYQRGLRLLSEPKDEKDYWGGSPHERLAQHVMVIYLRELTDFDHENQLLDLFFGNAPDQIRAQAIFWLGKVLENEKKERDLTEKSEVWIRCWKLWQARLDKAETEDVSKNWQEISDYMRWLVSAPMTLDQLYETLLKSIKYFQDRFDVMQLLDYAVKFCEQSPREAVSLLWETISSAIETWWRADEKVEGEIIRTAMISSDVKVQQIAIKVINRRGEQGDYQWRDLLDLK